MTGADRPEAASASLRRADQSDAPAIRRLVAAAYEGYTPVLGRTPRPMRADYDAALRDHEVWVLGAPDGTIVGVLELVPHDDHLWIQNVAVSPAVQGRGLGQRLLAHAEDEARRHGLTEVRLLTNERYEANVAMYGRYGYRETHHEPCEGTDLVHFRKPLRQA